jgi:hypothetical protein
MRSPVARGIAERGYRHIASVVTSGPIYLDASSAQTADEHRYLVRLDSLLPEALGDRVDPTEVRSLDYGGVLIWLTVPDVPDGESPVISNHLQVLYNAQALGAYWGCSHLWDDYDKRDPEHLCVPTSGVAPEDAAERAAQWVKEQLRRPLVRQEWDRRGRTAARRWVLTDTGRVIGSRGSMFRHGRRAPDRVFPLA